MPATDAGETSGIHNLRPRPTSLEDTIYIDNQWNGLPNYIISNIQTTWHSAAFLSLKYEQIAKLEQPMKTVTISVWNHRERVAAT